MHYPFITVFLINKFPIGNLLMNCIYINIPELKILNKCVMTKDLIN